MVRVNRDGTAERHQMTSVSAVVSRIDPQRVVSKELVSRPIGYVEWAKAAVERR
jgi:hypothetical protein